MKVVPTIPEKKKLPVHRIRGELDRAHHGRPIEIEMVEPRWE
jgi:hypothetical protein